MQIEQVREQIGLLQKSVEQLDEFTTQMIEARWRFEMLNRNPQLGVSGRERTTSADIAANIAQMQTQRATAIEVVLALTNTDSLDAARERFLIAVASYQTYGSLLELFRNLALDVPMAFAQSRTFLGIKADETISDEEVFATIETKLDIARQAAVDTCDSLTIGDLDAVTAKRASSLILRD